MRKAYFLSAVLACILLVPTFAFASWWNPTTWFQSSSAVDYSQSVQSITVPPTVSSEVPVPIVDSAPSSTVIVESTTSIQTSVQPDVNDSVTQSKITSLTTENASLEAKIVNLQSQLSSIQKNYSICKTNLAETNTTTSTVVQTPTPPQPVAVSTTASTNNAEQASMSLDITSPQAQTEDTKLNSLPALIVDIFPPDSQSYIHAMTVNVQTSGQGGVSTVYLYAGSTKLASALVNNSGFATFSDFSSLASPIAPGQPYTVEANVNLGTGTAEAFSISVSSLQIGDSQGRVVNATGNVNGNIITATDL
jgi:hypothetical protein